MPARKKTEVTTDPTEVLNFENLPEDGGPSAPATDDQPGGQETEEHDNGQKSQADELALLRAELEAAKAQLAAQPAAKSERPKADSELTPEELEIRKLRDELARTRGKAIDSAEELYEENVEGGILVHFLEDGLSSNGRNFYRGQEVTFGPEAYKDTIDRFGDSWLNLSDREQFDRWGSIKFRKGPWPGERSYEEESLKGRTITEQAPLLDIHI